MEKKKDIRQSLAAKFIAILLFFSAGAAALLGTFAVAYVSCGFGAADTFLEDPLCTKEMDRVMEYALLYVLVESDEYEIHEYSARFELERAGGFSAQVWDGDPKDGRLIGGWSEFPGESDLLCRVVETVPKGTYFGGSGGYFTVIGCLSNKLPAGSNFAVRFSMYNRLHGLPYGVTVALTAALYALALAALVFLFCAAGRKAGREGIALNWQDRIPLDLYLGLYLALLFLAALPYLEAEGGAPIALQIAMFCLSAGIEAVAALALLLTLAARFKKGKWWRNTILWRLCRWCARMWRRCWYAVVELVRILPVAWRVVLGVMGILGGQSLLVLLFVSGGFFIFLLTAALDAALVVAAAWMTFQLQKVRDMGAAWLPEIWTPSWTRKKCTSISNATPRTSTPSAWA